MKTSHVFESECDLKMHVRNLGYTLPLKIGDRNHFFDYLQVSGKFNGIYLRNETRRR